MFRLRSQIMISFSAIILIGTALMVVSINLSTRSGYRSFVKENDKEMARQLKSPLRDYYRAVGSWEGVEDFMQFPGAGAMRSGQMRGMMGKNRAMIPLIVLTDGDGFILYSTNPESHILRDKLDADILAQGQKILIGERIVGYVLAGSMIQTELNEQEKLFLNRTTGIIIAVSLLILAASALFSWFFSSRLAQPVSAMRSAADEIRSGNLSVRVPSEGKDEMAQLSSSFNGMAESLEKNDQWRKQIIADSAHELRTPVSLIQGNLEMILEGVYQADEKRIRSVYDETVVLTRLIDELQQLSSAESGSMTLNPEDIELSELMDSVLAVFRAGESKGEISLRNKINHPFCALITGDSQKLKQVFANVLANAFRHTPKGGFIEVSAEERDKAVLICIEDSGPGIEEEDLDKIFERFYRTDSARNRHHGGSGLGLAISREIVRLHGGRIYAQSPPGKGAQIFISLPFKKGES